MLHRTPHNHAGAVTLGELLKMQIERQQNENSTAAVVRFVPGTDRAKALKWLEECQKRGILLDFEVHQYDSRMGHPVWYIP